MKTFLNLIVLVSQHQTLLHGYYHNNKIKSNFFNDHLFYFIHFCDVPKTSNQLQEDLAKPGNKSHMNVIF